MPAQRQRPRTVSGGRCRYPLVLAFWLSLGGLAGTVTGAVVVSRSLPACAVASGTLLEAVIDIVVSGSAPNGLVIEEELPPGWTVARAEWTGLQVPACPVAISGANKWLFDPLGLPISTDRLSVTIRIPDGAEPGTYTLTGRAKWLESGVESNHATTGLSTLRIASDAVPYDVVLGRPTNDAVTMSVRTRSAEDLTFYIVYGTSPGAYSAQTSPQSLSPGALATVELGALEADRPYYYQIRYQSPGEASFRAGPEQRFHTQRAPGSTFSFAIQSDAHLYDQKGNADLYQVTMQNTLADRPDFLIDLGDTFGDDHHPTTITAAEMDQLHLNYRPYFDLATRAVPLFLCLGNHEGETIGYEYPDTTANPICTYATQARLRYYPNPFPNDFYSGNSTPDTYVNTNRVPGLPANYYAWEWGDALFVVLDAYRYLPSAKPDSLWDWTLGDAQYQWFKRTLENSTSKRKFVFAHHVLGQTRGGVAWADLYEWGGHNADGTWGFDTRRPGWAMPIHQLMVANGVTIFFQGHDHLFAREELDGIVYQECPMPSDATYAVGNVNAGSYTGDVVQNSGHLRVTVAPAGVTVDYVRAYLPADATPEHPNAEVVYSYTVGTRPWVVQFDAGEHGALVGPALQTVGHGDSALPVTAEPAYGYVFHQWSDGSTQNPRILASVLDDTTLTAFFRAAAAVVPDGTFAAPANAADAASGHGWWDLSGSYATTVAGYPLALDVVHDTRGKITGLGICTLGEGVVLPLPIKGRAKGKAGVVTVGMLLKGRGPDDTTSAKLHLHLTLEAATRQLLGTVTGTVEAAGVTTPADGDLALGLPAAMDGTWILRFELAQAGTAVGGTADLALSNGVVHAFTVRGKTAGDNAELRLAADPLDPTARAIRIRTTITPLEAGWALLTAFQGKGYGQTLGW